MTKRRKLRPITRHSLNDIPQVNNMKWATEYIKTNVSTILFTAKRHSTPDGPDG